MESIVKIQIGQFALIYLLLIVVLCLMKLAHISRSKQLLVSSVRMTVQLVLAGFLLTYIFQNPHPLFTACYILVMLIFACRRALSVEKHLNKSFKRLIIFALCMSSLSVLAYLILAVVGESVLNPQYAIPLCGMILGNSMTGISIGLRSFFSALRDNRPQINALLNLGVEPKEVLLPFANAALETALLPTINSMVGMGVVSLPGMMTGQILSGTLPMTAILYQISIMISICAAACLTLFLSLHFGCKSLITEHKQIHFT